jgi:hypothetical protein
MMVYPEIYSIKTPEKHAGIMIAKEPKSCAKRWKRMEFVSSNQYCIFKDDYNTVKRGEYEIQFCYEKFQ